MTVIILVLTIISATLSTAFITVNNNLLTNNKHINNIHHKIALAASQSDEEEDNNDESQLASNMRRALLASTLTAVTYNIATVGLPAYAARSNGYERVSPLQFIAATGDPDASSGSGANSWGIWRTDPGPLGLPMRAYKAGNTKPWLDESDFFLDENAIIMPPPQYPLPAGKYLVTGARTTTTGLTIDKEGNWKLDEGKLLDVTHLPCRAARYTDGSPNSVKGDGFHCAPGGIMPDVPGTKKQIYSVIFIIGKQPE